jgi:tRNA (cytidine/uridine-2'-O-)-methyltransferase
MRLCGISRQKPEKRHDEADFGNQAFLVFGKETAGLPDSMLSSSPDRCVRIPIMERARSLNLSVAVGVAAFEAMRQGGFQGLSEADPAGRLF